MEYDIVKKGIIFIIIILFLNTIIAPSICGNDNGTNQQFTSEISPMRDPPKTCSFSFYLFEKTGVKKHDVVISSDDAVEIYERYEALKNQMILNPWSDQTQRLQQDFINSVSDNTAISKEHLFSLLQNPVDLPLHKRLHILPFSSHASEWLCTFASTGSGTSFPIIILPRFIPFILTPIPRILLRWNTNDEAITSCGGLRSGTGFIAVGEQKGIALGFWGIGFTFSLPPFMGVYGLIGYAVYAKVDADHIEFYPPNNPPIITGVDPANGEENVPLSTSELRFEIEDPDQDLMSYTVTTEPDIGSGTGGLKPDGVYSIPINNLEYDKIYRWTIEVNDGKDTVIKQYSFGSEATPPFDPFEEGWQYRKQITINHTKVPDTLPNFPILIDTLNPDLLGKTQDDGGDILFMTNTGVASKLYHEIERYDATTGRLVVWVKIPSLSSSYDTVLYMYYGNPSCANLWYPEKVWDGSYVGVYHLSEGGTGTRYDSTFYDKNLVPQNYEGNEATLNGKISGADNFSGETGVTPEYLQGSDTSQYLDSASGTVSAWIYIESNTALGPESIITKRQRRGGGWLFEIDANKAIQQSYFDRDISYEWKDSISTAINWINGTWYYVVGTRGSSGNNIFINGMEVTYATHYTGSVPCTEVLNGHLNIGQDGSGEYDALGEGAMGYTGMIDEARISLTQRSPEWILTEYNNQNNPSNFLNIGPEELGP